MDGIDLSLYLEKLFTMGMFVIFTVVQEHLGIS